MNLRQIKDCDLLADVAAVRAFDGMIEKATKNQRLTSHRDGGEAFARPTTFARTDEIASLGNSRTCAAFIIPALRRRWP
jgi:hypothetical protein